MFLVSCVNFDNGQVKQFSIRALPKYTSIKSSSDMFGQIPRQPSHCAKHRDNQYFHGRVHTLTIPLRSTESQFSNVPQKVLPINFTKSLYLTIFQTINQNICKIPREMSLSTPPVTVRSVLHVSGPTRLSQASARVARRKQKGE